MSHAEYCAKCDEDQLQSLIEHANARLKVLNESGWVKLWTVSFGWGNIGWFAEDDYESAVALACKVMAREAKNCPNKAIEVEVSIDRCRPEEAVRLIKSTQRAAQQSKGDKT